MYFKDWTLRAIVYDAYGIRVWETSFGVTGEVSIHDIASFIREIKGRYPSLSVAALGVPGTVCGLKITYLPKFPKLQGTELAVCLQKEFHLDIFIENDINAMALAEVGRFKDFAHIAYVNGCIGVGIVLNRAVVKGAKGYAGELEYLCEDLSNQEKTFATSINVSLSPEEGYSLNCNKFHAKCKKIIHLCSDKEQETS